MADDALDLQAICDMPPMFGRGAYWGEGVRTYVLGRPGYSGTQGKQRRKRCDHLFGEEGWRTMHVWKRALLDRGGATLLYEQAYEHEFEANPRLLAWVTEYGEVYDNSLTNLGSGCDYGAQEASSTHLQDIAVRRVLLRKGLLFRGTKLLEIRGPSSSGYRLNPGQIGFHVPEHIVQPPVEGWWKAGSIEDFWQSNKVLVTTRDGLVQFARRCVDVDTFQVLYLDYATLSELPRTIGTRHWVFHAEHGLGRVKSYEPGDRVLSVVFLHSGAKIRFGPGHEQDAGELRDAEALLPAMQAIEAGAPLDEVDVALLLKHLVPMTPSDSKGRAVWLDKGRTRCLGDCVSETLVRSTTLENRQSLVRDLLTRDPVTLEFGPKFGSHEIYDHLTSVLARMEPIIALCARTGHHAALAPLAQIADVAVHRAVYSGSYNPEGCVELRLPVQDLATRFIGAVAREYLRLGTCSPEISA